MGSEQKRGRMCTGRCQWLPPGAQARTRRRAVLGEGRGSDAFFDALDHVIDVHGHIIGMGLSPDNRWAPESVLG